MNARPMSPVADDAPRLLFLTKYSPAGASSRYRSFQYLPLLQQEGFVCHVSPLFDDGYLHHRYLRGKGTSGDLVKAFFGRLKALLSVRRYDLVIIEYELLPYFPAVLESLLARLGVPYVVDYDDALFHQYDGHRNAMVRGLLGGKIRRVMRGAAAVIAGNRYLEDYARAAGARRVEVIPTVVNLERYSPARKEGSGFIIGWIGSPATAGYLNEVAPALRKVCSSDDARLRLVGAGDVDLPGVPVEILPWSEDSEVMNLQSMDVGIMPLPDTPWARGKSGLKLIQYMACGIPVVASPVGVNQELLQGGMTGFAASGPDQWVEALRSLRRDASLRARMGKAGRLLVEQRYSLQARWPEYLSVLRSLL